MPWGSAGDPVNGAGGLAHDSHAAGTGGSAPTFGLTGRHRRLGAAAEANSVPGLGLVPRPAMPAPGPARPALPAPARLPWTRAPGRRSRPRPGPARTARDRRSTRAQCVVCRGGPPATPGSAIPSSASTAACDTGSGPAAAADPAWPAPAARGTTSLRSSRRGRRRGAARQPGRPGTGPARVARIACGGRAACPLPGGGGQPAVRAEGGWERARIQTWTISTVRSTDDAGAEHQ